MSLPAAIGPYALEGPLGVGGMGEVVRGRHRLLDREVAVKIRQHTRSREEQRLAARFRHTATLQAELNHPHIAQVLDYIELPTLQALVLPYLGGGSIADRLQRGPMTMTEAMRLAIPAAEALAYAHARGIVHRDIKPDNLMLQIPGDLTSLRVTDFGVAKTADRSPDLTVAGANVGTVWYMSPEQFNHEPPTSAFDVYSLGATIYEMLTGQIAFESRETAAIFTRFLDGVPAPPIRAIAPTISPALAALIESAIALDPAHRPPTAAAFALLLRAVAESDGTALDDQDARRQFASADGPALRQMLRQMDTGDGTETVRAFAHLDARINGSTAVTRLSKSPLRAALPLLETMLDGDIDEEDEDSTLVMPIIDVDVD